MKPAPFAYAKARSVAHAIELLANDDARLLAGGQSLIATLNMRLSHPALLIDINGVGGLDRIAVKNGQVEIGALVRYAQARALTPTSRARAPLIALALPHIGHPAIRNRGTIGGSIAFADPAAELPACLLALGGEIDIAGPQGSAHGQGRRFLQGPVRDRAHAHAMCSPRSASRPRAPTPASASPNSRAATATTRWWGLPPARAPTASRLADLRLAYFGVGATPVRARKAETALADGDIDAAVSALAKDLDPDRRRAGVGRGEDAISPACCCGGSRANWARRRHERALPRHRASP